MMGGVTVVTAMAGLLFLCNWGGQILNANWTVQNSLLGESRGNPEPFTTSDTSGRWVAAGS